jgi:apolipoprotein D and lipocalin family protein
MKFAAVVVVSMCIAGAAIAATAKAPEPAKPVDAASFWTGRWYEIARTPKSFNKDCVAGTTDYQMKDGGLYEADACHDKTPDGKEDTIGGAMKILNPGQNTKIDVGYRVAFIPIHVENWVLDHDAGWMILGTPDLAEVHIYSREPHPDQALVDRLTKEIRDTGYTGELQFPAQSKP